MKKIRMSLLILLLLPIITTASPRSKLSLSVERDASDSDTTTAVPDNNIASTSLYTKSHAKSIFHDSNKMRTYVVHDEIVAVVDKWSGEAPNLKGELLGTRINCVAEDTWQVWIGTDKGINAIPKSSWGRLQNIKRFTLFAGLNDHNVLDISVDSANDVWAVTNSGIIHIQNEIPSTYNFPGMELPDITDIYFTGSDIWLGTNNGIIRFEKELQKFHKYRHRDGLPSDRILELEESEIGLWAITPKGVARWSKDESRWISYPVKK